MAAAEKTGPPRKKRKVAVKAAPIPQAGLPETLASPFPVVGIGASAGGLAAFEAFFSGMPSGQDPGMAFVLVQHLAPDHESMLPDLIRRYTRMEVFQVHDGIQVQVNCAYVIPPNCDMVLVNGALQLMEPSAPRGQRLPIDFFFRSLALDQQERAICIVLSGTGSDGTQGLRAVKEEGGLALAQSPETTEYDGMPRSALATGLVDYELPPALMAAQLLDYAARMFGGPFRGLASPAPMPEDTLRKIAYLLRARTGHDFSQYKPNTLQRRIERRMAVQRIETIEAYVGFLRNAPEEVDALFRDLLIGVTRFFRDTDAFRLLEEKVVPRLFEGKPQGAAVRVWCAGCSTGEEAYSIAMLLHEHQETIQKSFKVQVFATDIDAQAIAQARAGVFPLTVSADLSPERLSRFFSLEADGSGYRIHKTIRDLLIFSEQDLIKDPPFSKIDLLSCRNLLIYLSAGLQKKLIPLFHYALNKGGFLFQGTSETVGDFGNLFAPVDRKSKIYERKEDSGSAVPLTRMVLPLLELEATTPVGAGRRQAVPKPSLREITEQALLDQVGHVCALVNGQGDILFLRGRSGQYLEPMPGEAGANNILKMARDGLKREMATALHNVASGSPAMVFPGLRVKAGGETALVDLRVSPVLSPASPDGALFLVVLAASPLPGPDAGGGAPAEGTPSEVAALKRELLAKEEYLKASNEELETSNEELKSSNEELQSLNEELQSTNEELETSKEELQSVNEELTTVNTELQTKVLDFSRAINDMNNLLAGTGIGTIFLDNQLRILRFTPAATRVINLIQGDLGRPVGHLVPNLVGYDRLVADTREVLDTLAPKAVEVQTLEGKWFTMRIQVYRTLDNVIEGAVITFLDISEMKQAEAALRERDSAFRQLAASLQELVLTLGPDGRCDYLSPKWAACTGIAEALQLDYRWLDQIQAEDRSRVSSALTEALATGNGFQINVRLRGASGDHAPYSFQVCPVQGAESRILKWVGIASPVPETQPIMSE